MKKTALFSILTFFCLLTSSLHGATMNDYCVTPVSASSITKPNILVVTDYSGSMQYPAYVTCNVPSSIYNGKVAKCGSPSGTDNYDTSRTDGYYGLFDKTKYYKVTSVWVAASSKTCIRRDRRGNCLEWQTVDTSHWEPDTFEVNASCTNSDNIGTIGSNPNTACISGNLLNWITSTRIDVTRWVLTGGRTNDLATDTYQSEGAEIAYTDTNLGCTFTIAHTNTSDPITRTIKIEGSSCSLGTLSAAPIDIVPANLSADTGLIQEFYGKATIEYMIYNSDYKGMLVSAKDGTKDEAIHAISSQMPYNGTPTGEALMEAMDFFKQSNDHSHYNNSGGISRGNGAKDPWYDVSGGASKGVRCRKTFVLLISDGNWNGESADKDPVKAAFNMHTTDLRSDLNETQTVTTYVVYAFGDKETDAKTQGARAMRTTAVFGGFDDSDGNGYPYPFSALPSDSRTVAFDTTTGYLSGCDPKGTWNDLCKEWDKDRSGKPYNYFEADDPQTLKTSLLSALNSMLRKVSSGTAASVLASSEGSGANILQSVYYPKRLFEDAEISWTGEMQNLWYYIDPYLQNASLREDTNSNDTLDFQNDYAIEFFFDASDFKTKVKRYSIKSDGSRNAQIDSVPLEEIKNLWEVGSLLFQRDLSTSPRKIYTTINGSSFLTNDFATTNNSTLSSYLQAADTTEADKIINYVHGYDQAGYRKRTVTISGTTGVWKLGDIVSSTPKIQSSIPANTYHLHAPDGYSDATYLDYIKSSGYLNRGMAYVGGNDGMLHAFKFGNLKQTWSGQTASERAQLANPDASTPLGSEVWSFIPKNALPYLKYLMNPDYGHLNYVDLPSLVVDASISGQSTDTKTAASWKTILIGGMGLGGASKNSSDSCTAGQAGTCVKTPVTDVGYSSYFAINVTDPANPSLLWEFSNENLGFSTSGPAIIRVGDPDKNGKWFAVFASGPTGAIDTTNHQFLGKSDQKLRLFVLDLATGSLAKTIETSLTDAFGGSLSSAVIDVDKGDATSSGRYTDDVLYLGYTQKDSATSTWTKGGVLRLVTKGSSDPAEWSTSAVIKDIGPVTSSIAKLQDRKKKELWLYFGSGRYFYRYEDTMDDPSSQRALYGFKEPCYTTSNAIDASCTDSAGSLHNQSGSSPASSLSVGKTGWYINLDAATGTFGAERVITDPVAVFSGVVFFTTYVPSADVCASGGKTYIWAVKYNLGNAVGGMKGKVVTQVSTGVIQEVNLATGFTGMGNRRTTAFDGMPPQRQGMSVLIPPRPLKKFMHIREK